MIVDAIYPVEIGTASLSKKDGSRLWNLRFDFAVPVSEYPKIDGVLAQAIDLFNRNEDSGFLNIQWRVKWDSVCLMFHEEKKALKGKNPSDDCLELRDVEFKPKAIACWKNIKMKSADGEDEDTERTLVLQFRTTVPKTKLNSVIVHRFAEGRAYCRLRGVQSDLFENKDAGAKVNLDTAFATGVLSACNAALPGETIDSTDDLVNYLDSVGKTDKARMDHLKKIVRNGGGSKGVATSIKNLNAIFSARKIVLRDIGDIKSEIASTTWAELYEIITTKSITWK